MARLPRVTIPSHPHHIIQHGNNQQPTFFVERNFHVCVDCLRMANGNATPSRPRSDERRNRARCWAVRTFRSRLEAGSDVR